MQQYVGTDIIEIARIKQAIARQGERFLRRIYTDAELKFYGQNPQSLAARFAGKEAVMKLLGARGKGLSFREIEIFSHPDGRPALSLYGRAKSEADKLGIREIAISLSHSKEYAIAAAIGAS